MAMVSDGSIGSNGPSGVGGEYFCPVCLNKMITSFPFPDLEYHCNSCDKWNGFGRELLNYEQFINEKRFRILNEIINEHEKIYNHRRTQ